MAFRFGHQLATGHNRSRLLVSQPAYLLHGEWPVFILPLALVVVLYLVPFAMRKLNRPAKGGNSP